MEYTVAIGENTMMIENEVLVLLDDGWKPLGGVSVSMEEDCDGFTKTFFAQAMVRGGGK